MKRAMSVWCPMLAIDLLRRRDKSSPPDRRPILLTEHRRQRHIVTQACERAIGAGVSPGMALGDARAILPAGKTRVEPHVPERTEAKLRALASWATRFAPSVMPDPPDGLMLDVTGCARAWKGEARLISHLTHAFDHLGIRARACIAPTFGAAWALARFSDLTIVRDGTHREALSPLPTESLRLEADIIEALAALGIERVEHLMALPRRTLPARFGASVLLRLDQATGEAIETIEPVRPTDPPSVERLFDGSTTQWEAIERTVRDLLTELCARLRSMEHGVLRLESELLRSDLPPAKLIAVLSRPSREPNHLWSILRPKLERTNLGFGVEGIVTTAMRTERVRHEQSAQWESDRAVCDKAGGELLDTLSARLGHEHVLCAHLRASHRPDRSVAWIPVMERLPARSPEPPPGDRPTVLFAEPLEAGTIALTPDGPVLSLSFGGSDHTIARCIGPERIGPEWWMGDRQTRDYFKLQDEDGRWLWAFRESDSRRWLIHGVWA